MPRPSRPWFRMYVEALADQKLRRLPPVQRWLWVGILAAARQSPKPGWLMSSEAHPHDVNTLADLANVPVKEVGPALRYFHQAGMIEAGPDNVWIVTHWDERQYESDTSTERTRRHRSKPPDETPMERSNVVTRNGQTPSPERSRERPHSQSHSQSLNSSEVNAYQSSSENADDDGKWKLAATWGILAERHLQQRNREVAAKGGDQITTKARREPWLANDADETADRYRTLAAAYLNTNPDLDPAELADMLEETAKTRPDLSWENV